MEALNNMKVIDFGVTITLLIVIYRALTIVSQIYVSKKIPTPVIANLACQQDPKHFQRIQEIHSMTLSTEQDKAHGRFSCQFKDRDEVRDLMEIMRQNVQATKDLTIELRLARNGNSRAKA